MSRRWLARLAGGFAVVAAPAGAWAVGGASEEGGPAAVAAIWQDGAFACSGVLYAPDRVVTAAHCVDHLAPDDPQSEVRFGGQAVVVAHITMHPDHFSAAEADVAVLWLAAVAPVEPMPLRVAGPGADWDLWTVRVAGWGGAEPEDASMGEALRSFAALPEDLTESSLLFDGGEAFVCHGDSGGAVVLGDGAASELVGVVVGGPGDCGGVGEAVRVDVFAGFLEDPEGTAAGDRPFGEDDDGEDDDDGAGGGPLALGGEDPGVFGSAGCGMAPRTHLGGAGLLALGILLGPRRRRTLAAA